MNWESYSFPQQKYVLAEEKREARVALLNSACFCKTNSIQNFIKVTVSQNWRSSSGHSRNESENRKCSKSTFSSMKPPADFA